MFVEWCKINDSTDIVGNFRCDVIELWLVYNKDLFAALQISFSASEVSYVGVLKSKNGVRIKKYYK